MTLLRVVLWLIPSFIVPVIFFVSESITHDWFAAVIPALSVCSAMGYFDCRIALQQKREPARGQRQRLTRTTILFILLQMIIIPTLSLGILYGYCMVTGFHL